VAVGICPTIHGAGKGVGHGFAGHGVEGGAKLVDDDHGTPFLQRAQGPREFHASFLPGRKKAELRQPSGDAFEPYFLQELLCLRRIVVDLIDHWLVCHKVALEAEHLCMLAGEEAERACFARPARSIHGAQRPRHGHRERRTRRGDAEIPHRLDEVEDVLYGAGVFREAGGESQRQLRTGERDGAPEVGLKTLDGHFYETA